MPSSPQTAVGLRITSTVSMKYHTISCYTTQLDNNRRSIGAILRFTPDPRVRTIRILTNIDRYSKKKGGRNAYCTIGYSAFRVWPIHPLMLVVSHPRRIPGKVKSVLLCISSHCQSPSNPKSIILGCLLNFVSDS